jgi:ethanolamine ammonia-lyase small subunit
MIYCCTAYDPYQYLSQYRQKCGARICITRQARRVRTRPNMTLDLCMTHAMIETVGPPFVTNSNLFY